jgi:2-methylcitrate dehydratase PrpD
MTCTWVLAQLAIETPDVALGETGETATRQLILDTLGSAMAGWEAPGIHSALRSMQRWGGAPEATVWAYGDRLPTPNAAFVNGSMVHAMDYDDVHLTSVLHLMSSLVPAALAVAEMMHRSGRDLMTAVALGVEVAVRIGIIAKQRNMSFGYLPSSTVGIFGTTAACCRLLGLNVEQTVNALGIAYAQSSGSRQALLDHTLTKRIQPAFASRSALWASFLAADGITGPHRALEGEAGFFKVYVGSDPPDSSELAGLRDGWEIERVRIKRYPSCGATHASTMVAIELATEEGLEPDDIKEVTLDLGRKDIWFVGKPWKIGKDPQVNAQFSAAYSAALGLVRRRAGLREYSPESVLSDRQVSDLASRVQIREIPNTEHLRTDQVEVTISIVTRDGRKLSRESDHWRKRLSRAEVLDKFSECAEYSGIWTPEQARSIVEVVSSLEMVEDVSVLAGELLVSDGAQSLLEEAENY